MRHGGGFSGHEGLDLGDAQVFPGEEKAGFHGHDLLEHVQGVAGVAALQGGHGFLV